MTNHLRTRRGAGVLLTAAATLGLGLAAVPAASAAGASTCDAAAIQLSVLGAPAITPIQANAAGQACADADGVLDLDALGVAVASAAQSTTRTVEKDHATAASQVTGLEVGVAGFTGALTAPLLSGPSSILGQINGNLAAMVQTGGSIDTAIAPLKLLGLSVTGTDSAQVQTDVGASLPAALQATLPNLVDADVLSAGATAVCANGSATLTGSTNLTDAHVLGSLVDADDPAGKVLSLDTAHLSLSDLESLTTVLKSITVQAAPASVLGLAIGTGTHSLYDVLVNPSGGLLGLVDTALLPLSTTTGTLVSTLSAAVQPLLDTQQIALPAGVLHAVITPHKVETDGDVLTATTLQVDITGLGQPLLSGSLAHASVSAAAAGCPQSETVPTPTPTPTPGPAATPTPAPAKTPTPTPTPKPTTRSTEVDGGIPTNPAKYTSLFTEMHLECSNQPLRLIDVRPSGATTFVRGVAEKQFVGKPAEIYLAYGKKRVGTGKVGANGTFAARVALPPAKIRDTNAARYYAVVSGHRTSALKFARRMYSTRLVAVGGTVTFQGYTTAPRAVSQAPVKIQQRVSCTQFKNVATAKPDSKGQFAVTFKASKKTGYAVYRAQTTVPKSARSKAPFPTFTLPQVLGLS